MAGMEKVVQLERARTSQGQLGSFGFSILGGAGTRFPAVVCEVDPGGFADMSGKVKIGDQLLILNNDDVEKLPPKDLVQRIRNAPSPSVLVFKEDEDLRFHVLALLRKQERRAQARQRAGVASTSSSEREREGEEKVGGHRKVTAPMLSVTSEDGERKKKRKREKTIEVEPSVNINDGKTGDIVKVRHNMIVGRIELPQTDDSAAPETSQRSPQPSHHQKTPPSPIPSSHPHNSHAHGPLTTEDESLGNHSSAITGGQGSPGSTEGHSPRMAGQMRSVSPSVRVRSGSGSPRMGRMTRTLEQRTALHSKEKPGQLSPRGSPRFGGSNDSCNVSSGSSGGSLHTSNVELPQTEGRGAGGVSVSDSSGMNSMSESASMLSFEEKMKISKLSDFSSKLAEATATPPRPHHAHYLESSSGSDRIEGDSGVHVHMDRWSAGVDHVGVVYKQGARGSLSEEVFVSEIQRESSFKSNSTATVGGGERDSAGSTPPASPTKRTPKSPKLVTDALHEQLMSKYRNTPARSPSGKRANPHVDAVSLARRMFMLNGFKKSEIAPKLYDMSEFGQAVAKEYLRCFDFERRTLDDALRQFLSNFSLTGESQERERIMVHFSERYYDCNLAAMPDSDTVHGLTVALLLLNTDLHTNHGGHKMTFSQFVSNLEGIGVRIPKDMLRKYYDGIKRHPLVWAVDEEIPLEEVGGAYSLNNISEEEEDDCVRVYHVTIPGTFVEVELPGNAMLFKEGEVIKKNVMEGAHKKVPRGKRQWRSCYAYLKGFLLYLWPPRSRRGSFDDLPNFEDTSSAIIVTHCLAMRAYDYHKKASVVRVTTSDWHTFLIQANNVTDMMQWMGAINKAAALYSSPPLAAPVSSRSGFQRPTFPLAPTRNNREQQIESHEAKIKGLDKEMQEHQAYKPKGKHAKHGQLQDWFDKYEFLQFEINRFRIYLASLTTDTIVDFNAPLPSGLVPSPSISTLANPGGLADNGLIVDYPQKAGTPPYSPSASRLDRRELSPSPLVQHRKYS